MVQISSLIWLCSIVKIKSSRGYWRVSRKKCRVSEPPPVWPVSLIIDLSCHHLHVGYFFLSFFYFFFLAGVRRVSGINIYTPKELEVANGTSARLKCTFTSTHPVSLKSVSVSWNFRALNSGQDESVCTSCVSFLWCVFLFLFWGGGWGGFTVITIIQGHMALYHWLLRSWS